MLDAIYCGTIPHDSVPQNQRDLECVEQCQAFSAEPDKVEAEKIFQFFVYPFVKMEEWIIKVRPNNASSTFGLKLTQDPQYD